MDVWFEKYLRVKPDKVVIKLYDKPGVFKAAVNIPTVMWPLNGPYELFHVNNTEFITDKSVLDIIDAQPYRIGYCYSNAGGVTQALVDAGYNAKTYVGWLFCNVNEWPIHHTWTVLDGKHIIDLADEFALASYNRDKFEAAESEEARRELYVNFHKWASQHPHSQRTAAGRTSPNLLYVGSECTPEEGRAIYNSLTDQYPNHPCRERVGKDNMTPMQRQLKSKGIE